MPDDVDLCRTTWIGLAAGPAWLCFLLYGRLNPNAPPGPLQPRYGLLSRSRWGGGSGDRKGREGSVRGLGGGMGFSSKLRESLRPECWPGSSGECDRLLKTQHTPRPGCMPNLGSVEGSRVVAAAGQCQTGVCPWRVGGKLRRSFVQNWTEVSAPDTGSQSRLSGAGRCPKTGWTVPAGYAENSADPPGRPGEDAPKLGALP